MVVLVFLLSLIALLFAWILWTPLVFRLDTNQPSGLLYVGLRGLLTYRIYIENDRILSYASILFFKSEKELFTGGTKKAEVKKKTKNKKRPALSGCLKT